MAGSGLPSPKKELRKRTTKLVGGGRKGPPLKKMPEIMIVGAQVLDMCDVVITPECIMGKSSIFISTQQYAYRP